MLWNDLPTAVGFFSSFLIIKVFLIESKPFSKLINRGYIVIPTGTSYTHGDQPCYHTCGVEQSHRYVFPCFLACGPSERFMIAHKISPS